MIKNMNYFYNVEYFSPLWNQENQVNNREKNPMLQQNNKITNFRFQNFSPLNEWKQIHNYQSIQLKTSYPGLLIGTGNLHQIGKVAGIVAEHSRASLKQGFTFDYVSGLPFLPGASLKGILRSCFPKTKESDCGYIKETLKEIPGIEKSESIDIYKLTESIFENKDIFLGAYPVLTTETTLMEADYITPHKDLLKNPIPIQILKVKPGITFEFGFVLSDYCEEEGGRISADQKLQLFKSCLLDVGIGAKTNVGYGNMVK